MNSPTPGTATGSGTDLDAGLLAATLVAATGDDLLLVVDPATPRILHAAPGSERWIGPQEAVGDGPDPRLQLLQVPADATVGRWTAFLGDARLTLSRRSFHHGPRLLELWRGSELAHESDADADHDHLRRDMRIYAERSRLALIRWDPNGIVQRWFGQAEVLFGWSEDEVLGKRFDEIGHLAPETLPTVLENNARVRSGERLDVVQLSRNLRRDGSALWCEWTNVTLVSADGRIEGTLSLVADVTDRERLQERARFAALTLDQLRDAVITADPHGVIRGWNRGASRIYGYLESEVLGRPIDFLSAGRAPVCPPAGSPALRPDGPEIVQDHRCSDGSTIQVLARFVLLDGPGDLAGGLILVGTDITLRRRTEQALRDALQRLKFHFENTPLGVVEWDSGWRVVRWSRRAEEIFGWSEREVVGLRWDEIGHIPAELVETVRSRFRHYDAIGSQTYTIANENITKFGRRIHCEWYTSMQRAPDGSILSAGSLVLDVTARRLDAERLRRSEQLLDALSSAAGILLGADQLTPALRRVLRIVGEAVGVDQVYLSETTQTDAGAHLSVPWAEWRAPGMPVPLTTAGRPAVYEDEGFRRWYEAFAAGEEVERHADDFPASEAAYLRQRGIRSLLAVPVFVDDSLWGAMGLSTFRDRHRWSVAERNVLRSLAANLGAALKRARMLNALAVSEERFRILLEEIPCGVLVHDTDLAVQYANPVARDLLGLGADAPVDLDDPAWHAVGEDGSPFSLRNTCVVPARNRSGSIRNVAARFSARGRDAWFLFTSEALAGGDGSSQVVTLFLDVTERRLAEEHTRTSLREKEVLLQEVFHRVKNNLQIVSTLLRMQGRTTTHPEALKAIDDAHNRVFAMALVHEHLYKSPTLATVDLAAYARSLARSFLQLARSESQTLDIVVQGAAPAISIDHTITLGLILNELLTNTVKHGVAGRPRARVTIRVGATPPDVEVSVHHDGTAPADPAASQPRGLGIRIVTLLVEQLRGSISTAADDDGFTVTLRAPLLGQPPQPAPTAPSTAPPPAAEAGPPSA